MTATADHKQQADDRDAARLRPDAAASSLESGRRTAARPASAASLLLLLLVVVVQVSWLGFLGYVAWRVGARLV